MDELFIDEELPPDEISEVKLLAATMGIFPQLETSDRISQLCQFDDHQGLLARMGEFPYEDLNALKLAVQSRVVATGSDLQIETTDPTAPLFVVCDGIQDAHNFGAILRCCDAVRASGVIIAEQGQALVTPHVARASSGAVNHLHIFLVPNLTDAVQVLRINQFQIMAATEKSTTPLWSAQLNCPVALLVGSEAAGISAELLQLSDHQLAIPMLGHVDSLNAAVAVGILLYECRRQQQFNPRAVNLTAS